MKEVYFNEFCSKCVNRDTPDTEEPCNECLTFPAREDSHKPVMYEERNGQSRHQGSNCRA